MGWVKGRKGVLRAKKEGGSVDQFGEFGRTWPGKVFLRCGRVTGKTVGGKVLPERKKEARRGQRVILGVNEVGNTGRELLTRLVHYGRGLHGKG